MALLPEQHIDSAALLSAIVGSSEDAIISTDLNGTITSWNGGAERIYGYTASEAIGQPNDLIIPSDRSSEEEDVLRRLRAGEAIDHYNTIRVRKDGTRIEVSLAVSAIHNQDREIIGVSKIARDVSQRKHLEREAVRLAAIVEFSDDAIISKDLTGVITSWNQAAERIFGYTAAEAVGQSIRLIIPHEHQHEEDVVLDHIRRGQTVDHFETVRRRKDGVRIPISLTVSPIQNQAGVVIGASKIARDISERKRAEAEMRRASRQTAFLARMAPTLSSLDYQETLKGVARLAVPDIADWCAVDIVQEDGQIARLAVAHLDPAKIELAKLVRERYEDATAFYSVPYVIRTGRPAIVPEITDHMIVAVAKGDDEHIRLMRELGLRSYICVPLMARGRALGALTLASSQSGRRYTDADVRFAEDVASRAAMAVENARAYDQLQKANRLKDDFLATLSHELRTPLNAILGYSRMLTAGIVTGERVTRALDTIERNATALTQLVEDILDVSRIASGKLRLNVQPVDLSSVLQEAVATVKPAAEAKRIGLQTVIDPQVGLVSGDPDRLRQIVWNLLSNAVKFTPREGLVQLRLERVNSSVDIVVTDTGIGIAPDFIPHIFERFRQADSGTARQHAGLGLGLAIVRNLVEMHGGTVQAASGDGGSGTTFRVKLPLMAVHSQPELDVTSVHPRQAGTASPGPMLDLSGTHVLIVDDEPDAVTLLKEILTTAGARVTTAKSARTALETIQQTRPDVLVTDVGMPAMDGFELIERLRRLDDAALRDIPAAALTAYARTEDRAKALRSGFEMHLAKPIDPVELVAAVKALARRSGQK
jgi:PAS domain S-box-containing protein